MKFLLAFLFLAVVSADEEFCYGSLKDACHSASSSPFQSVNCNSKYASFNKAEVSAELQNYAMKHIAESYRYLLLTANFGNYHKSREGFQKYFQKLSDTTWEQSIDLIKHITKRGGEMIFSSYPSPRDFSKYGQFELGSVTVALDVTKDLARDAHKIHHKASERDHYDPEVASYIEENFVHKHSSLVREISGYANDLKKLYASAADSSLALFLFDEYIKS